MKLIPLPPTVFAIAGLRWSPDGSSIVYVNNERDSSNLWSQPIDGKPAKQLTHFESSQIFRFASSPNGKQLLLERGTNFRDVVLLATDKR